MIKYNNLIGSDLWSEDFEIPDGKFIILLVHHVPTQDQRDLCRFQDYYAIHFISTYRCSYFKIKEDDAISSAWQNYCYFKKERLKLSNNAIIKFKLSFSL